MGLDKLKRHLEAQATVEANGILDEARTRADSIREEIVQRARVEADAFEDGVAEAERRARGTVVQARGEASRTVSRAFDEVLEMTIERSLERLTGLDDEKYRAYIERCLSTGSELLGEHEISVCRSADFELMESLGRTVAGTVEGAGGILLSTGDGKALDLRFDTMVDGMRPRIREIVLEQLSEGGDD